MRTVCVIPARMGSVRFPGKPLAPLLGMPLVLHVWNRCRLCQGFERIVVATCDAEIREAVELPLTQHDLYAQIGTLIKLTNLINDDAP